MALLPDVMTRPKRKAWQLALAIVLLPLIVVFAAIALVLSAISTAFLHLAIWSWWCLRGRDILFVYSESPLWRDHIEERILPFLGDRATVLNWSERKRWRLSLARLAFYHFGGYRQFNPIAIVFRPFHRTRSFRCWGPFRELKQGRPAALEAMEREFFLTTGLRSSFQPQRD